MKFFIYDNRNLEEVTSYKYLGTDIHHKLNWNYNIEKSINGGWKACFGLVKVGVKIPWIVKPLEH